MHMKQQHICTFPQTWILGLAHPLSTPPSASPPLPTAPQCPSRAAPV